MAIELPVCFLQTYNAHILTFEDEESHLIDLLCDYRNGNK